MKLTLGISLSRAQADRLTVRAIADGKSLAVLVAEILRATSTDPTARHSALLLTVSYFDPRKHDP